MTIVKWEQLVESFKFNVNLRSKIFLFFFEVFLNFSEPIDSVLKNEIILLEDDSLCILTASWQIFYDCPLHLYICTQKINHAYTENTESKEGKMLFFICKLAYLRLLTYCCRKASLLREVRLRTSNLP